MGTSPSKIEPKEKPIIMVLGGPGTGKGTQCDRLVKEFGLKHISLGDILRAEVKSGTQIGKECNAIMEAGKLVPVNLTMELVRKAMTQAVDARGFLLDGFPRAVNQAKEFHKQVRAPSLVLYLHAPSQVLIHRLMQRGQTSNRADDNIQTINKRLVTFKKESLPVISYYEKANSAILKKVCTVTTPDDVYTQVQKAVKKVLASPPPAPWTRHVRRRQTHKAVHHRRRRTGARHHHRRRRKRRKTSSEECPGHPQGSPVPPPPAQQCLLM